MKTATALTAGIAIVLGFAAPRQVEARVDVSFEVFYESLEPYGAWFEVADYGYCWQPTAVDAGWRPYTVGRWVYTDAGWTWVSDEPWGWATYHYGRWILLEDEGWVWWPDTEWAPAWVSWRYSGSHVGWAPLPPEARWHVSVGFGPWVDVYYDIGPACYTFVESRHFCSPRLREWVMPRRQNVTFIQSTVNITNISHRDTVIYNEGPRYEVMAELSDTPVRRLRLDRRTDVEFDARTARAFRDQVKEDRIEVIAPVIRGRSADLRPDKVVKRVDRALVDRGWARVGDSRAVQEAHEKVKRESAAVIPPGLPPAPPPMRSRMAKDDTGEPGSPRIPKAQPAPGAPPVPKATPVPEAPPPEGKRKLDERITPPRLPGDLPPKLKPKDRDGERATPPQSPQNLKPLPKPRHQTDEGIAPRAPSPDAPPQFRPKPKSEGRLTPQESLPKLKPPPKPQPRNEADFIPPPQKPRPTPPPPKMKERPVPAPAPPQVAPPQSKPAPKGKGKDNDPDDHKKKGKG